MRNTSNAHGTSREKRKNIQKKMETQRERENVDILYNTKSNAEKAVFRSQLWLAVNVCVHVMLVAAQINGTNFKTTNQLARMCS